MWQHTFAFAINALFSQCDCIQLYLNECFVFETENEKERASERARERERENEMANIRLLIEIQTIISHLLINLISISKRAKIANFTQSLWQQTTFATISIVNWMSPVYICVSMWYVIEPRWNYIMKMSFGFFEFKGNQSTRFMCIALKIACFPHFSSTFPKIYVEIRIFNWIKKKKPPMNKKCMARSCALLFAFMFLADMSDRPCNIQVVAKLDCPIFFLQWEWGEWMALRPNLQSSVNE